MFDQNVSWDARFNRLIDDGIFPKVLNRINIFGYSRTGKSTLVHKRLRSHRVTFHQAMPLDDLIGGFALIDGTTKWVDGPAVRALRNGETLQIDECDQIPPECQTMFYALMDDPAAITLPNGERVEAAPGYNVVTTMNPTPECLPHPVFDRFDVYLIANTLSEGTRRALGSLAKNAEGVIAFGQTKIDWQRPASVNAFLAANKLRNAGFSDERVADVLGWTGVQAADYLTAVTSE